MADNVFQSDLKIRVPSEGGEKVTITLNERGDLQLLDGNKKLSSQLIRALINDNSMINSVLNTPVSIRNLKILFNLILRNFRQNQLDYTNKADPYFSGYNVYRLKTGSTQTYDKVSPNIVTYKFTNSGLINNTEYRYAVTKVFNGVFESNFTEKIVITPTNTSSKQEVIIGQEVVAMAGDKKVDFYVDNSPKFKGSELMEDILSMDVQQDTLDPRKYTVNVVIQDLRGGQVPIAAVRRNPAT